VSAISAATIGYIATPLKWFERIVLSVAGLALIIPGIITDAIGLACFGFVFLRSYLRRKEK